MEWLCLRPRDGSADHDSVRYSGYQVVRAERSAISETVRMKFSVNWLREFVELPSTVEELANVLTLAGIEIEGIEKRGVNFDKVIVAQIVTSAQHPNADRLSVCAVD